MTTSNRENEQGDDKRDEIMKESERHGCERYIIIMAFRNVGQHPTVVGLGLLITLR